MPKDELIEALEKATGPDRELDAAIFYDLLGHCRHANKVRSGAQSDTGFDCPDCGADSWGNTGPTGQRLHHTVPAYSASIDAALTLVPEGWSYEARQGPSGYPHIWDLLTIKSGDVRYTRVTGRAKSAALAICIAALRAKGDE